MWFLRSAFILLSLLSVFGHVTAQSYCTPSYTGPGNPNTGGPTRFYTHILDVAFAEIDHDIQAPFNVNNTTIYNDYTGSFSTELTPGITYPLSITVGNGANPQTVGVWIDYNQNKIFDASELVFTQRDTADVGDHSMYTNITIPANATIGKTRMRIGTVYGFNRPDPCSNNIGTQWSQDFLDYEIEVVKPDVQRFESINVVQNNRNEITPGSTGNELIRIDIETNAAGSRSPLTVDSVLFSLLGTSDINDVKAVQLYYSGKDVSFDRATPLGSKIKSPSTNFSINSNKELLPGQNYFWLAVDIDSSALIGNIIDARCNGAFIISQRVPQNVNPFGEREIGYCPARGSKGIFVYTRRVQLNTINQFSGNSFNGYGDYTWRETELQRGQKYQLSIEAGNSVNENFNQVWIDYNQDGDFSDLNERVFFDSIKGVSVQNPGFGPVTDSITIPQNAKIGPTRMRVITSYIPTNRTSRYQLPDECTSPVEIGEVEDYTVIIAEDGQPVAGFFATTVCQGAATRFFDQSFTFGNYNINSWKWYFGDGDSSSMQSPTHIYQNPGVYYVKLIVNSNLPGIPDTLVQTVTVEGLNPDFTMSNQLTNRPIVFTDQTTGGDIFSYLWDFGDPGAPGNTSGNPNPTFSYDSAGFYDVILIVRSRGGCIDTVLKTVEIDSVQKPIAYFASITTTPYYDQEITLEDQSVNRPDNWNWTIDPNYVTYRNSTSNSSQNPLLTFDSLTRYKVLLQVSNAAGQDTFSRFFETRTYNPPTADFEANPLINIRAGQLVSFIDKSVDDPTSWEWNFGDGDTAMTQFPNHAYESKGNYNVTLKVSNPAGSDSKTRNQYIRITDHYNMCDNATPSSPLFRGSLADDGDSTSNYSENSNCTFLIEPDCAGPITLSFSSFEFGSGDHLEVYDGKDENGIPLFSGRGLTGSSIPKDLIANSGAMFIKQVTNNVDQKAGFLARWATKPNVAPRARIDADTVAYENSPYFLNAEMIVGTGNSFAWDFDQDGVIDDSSQNTTITYAQTGTKTVRLYVENCKGKDTVDISFDVIIPSGIPVADFTVSKDSILPFETTQLLNRSGGGPTSWKWEISPQLFIYTNGSNDSSVNPEVQFFESGTYEVSLTVSNLNGSGKKLTKKDFIYVKPTAQMCVFPFEQDQPTGRIFDSGGEDFPYSNSENCTQLIDPCADEVYLEFERFDLAPGDFLRVYDGEDNTGIPLHTGNGFSGSALPPRLTAESGKMFIEMRTSFSITADGFIADWSSKPTQIPEASFSGPDTAYTGGHVVYFDNLTKGNAEAYYWDYFGINQFPDSAGTGEVAYTNTGVNRVQLRAVNCAGSDTAFKLVRVINPTKKPLPAFTANTRKLNINDQLVLIDTSKNGPNTWQWEISPEDFNFVNGTDKNSARPEIEFTSTGDYDVKLYVENVLGEDSITKQDYINVFEYCEPETDGLNTSFIIERFEMSNINHVTGNIFTDYVNVADEIIQAEIGGRYEFELERFRDQENYNATIWIDFNRDGDFTDANEEVADLLNGETNLWIDSIEIPSNLDFGPTSLRIAITGFSSSTDPCSITGQGQYFDYEINIGPDQTAPVITLLGDNPLSIDSGSVYAEPGVTAFDWVDGDLSPFVQVSGSVNEDSIGSYELYYNVEDAAGNEAREKVRIVKVVPDATPPVITLNGDNPETVYVFEEYVEAGATAIDNIDGDISDEVVISGTVDTARVDTYELIYTVYDNAGLAAEEKIRRVFVVDTGTPNIQLIGADTAYHKKGETYIDSGATVIDNYYQDIVPTYTDSVNEDSLGTYMVYYNAVDPSGNVAREVSRVVVVQRFWKSVPESESKNLNFVVYPNPNDGKFFIEFDRALDKQANLIITTTAGKMVREMEILPSSSTFIELNLKEMPAGMYFIQLQSAKQSGVRKINIQH